MTMPETLKPGELVVRLRHEISPERREEIMSKGWDYAIRHIIAHVKVGEGFSDHPRSVAESWMIDPKDELIEEAADAITALLIERKDLIFMANDMDHDGSLVPWRDKYAATVLEWNDAETRLTALQSDLERVTKQRDDALEAEDEAKDAFWAIYHDYLEKGGAPLSTEAAHTALSARALTAEAALVKARTALELAVSRGCDHCAESIRGARLALSAGEEENGR